VECLERREVVVTKLEEALRLSQVLQPVLAEVTNIDSGIEEIARRMRDQHLAAVSGGGNARGSVHIDTDVVLAGDDGLAGVDAYADANRAVGERALRSLGGGDGAGGALKRHEEGVALRTDLDATVVLEGAPEDAPVLSEDIHVPVAELVDEPCRALDIGEEEGDRPARNTTHASSLDRLAQSV